MLLRHEKCNLLRKSSAQITCSKHSQCRVDAVRSERAGPASRIWTLILESFPGFSGMTYRKFNNISVRDICCGDSEIRYSWRAVSRTHTRLPQLQVHSKKFCDAYSKPNQLFISMRYHERWTQNRSLKIDQGHVEPEVSLHSPISFWVNLFNGSNHAQVPPLLTYTSAT